MANALANSKTTIIVSAYYLVNCNIYILISGKVCQGMCKLSSIYYLFILSLVVPRFNGKNLEILEK